jgi:uncharacterized protein (TIGR00661 family)
MTRSVIRVFTCGADRKYGYHYEPASFRCVPPLIRAEAKLGRADVGEHVLLYSGLPSFQPRPADVAAWARKNRQRVIAYGFAPECAIEGERYVSFRRPNPRQFLDDMATSRGVMTTAGLSTPIEAFLLRKPLVVVPIPRQWEQTVNAFQLHEAKIACVLLETPTPAADHPLLPWMRTGSDFVLNRILDEPATAATGRLKIARPAA